MPANFTNIHFCAIIKIQKTNKERLNMLKDMRLVNRLLNQAQCKYNKPFKHCIFSQTWPNTALGYKHSAGCDVITTADTIVIYCPEGPAMVYYESELLAYKVERPNKKFFEDLSHQALKDENIYEEA